jgi:hypothetical protein
MEAEELPGLLHAHGSFIFANCIFVGNTFRFLIGAGVFLFDRCLFDFAAFNVTNTAMWEMTNCASFGDVAVCPWPDATESIAATETGTVSRSPDQSQSPAPALQWAQITGIAAAAVVGALAVVVIAWKIMSMRRGSRQLDTEPLDPVAGLPSSVAKSDSDGF